MSQQTSGPSGGGNEEQDRTNSSPSSETEGAGSPGGGPQATSRQPVEEEVLSPTLFSFLEPALDAIGSFSTPMVIAGVIALVSGAIVVAFVSSMRLYGIIDIIVGAVLIGTVALIFLSSVVAAFISRTGRYGVNSLIMLAAFTGIIIVISIIGFENNRRMDVTATNQFSLANRTKELLKELEQPIRATAFYKSKLGNDPGQIMRRLKVEDTLKEFSARTGKFSYRIVDPDLKPDVAAKYFGARPIDFVSESVVVEGTDTEKFDVVSPRDQAYSQLEQDLVTSMLVATGKERKVIYFLSGHGQRSIESTSADGYSQLRTGLEQDNYRVEVLRWDPVEAEVDVPVDAALMVIARPTAELPEAHAEVLDLFLQGQNRDGTPRREGGRMIFLAESETDQTFRNFLIRWGVLVDEGYILDLSRSVPGNPNILRLAAYNPQAPAEIILPRGEPLQVSFMPGATALGLLNDGLRLTLPLAATSGESYLIDDPERTEPVTEGEDADRKGPFSPVVLVRGLGPVGSPAPATQPADSEFSWLVVFGDSDFLANSFYGRGSGADLFLNSTNYLLGDFSLVSIRDKAFTFREFNLNRNEERFVRWSSWLFLPGLLALMAAFVWWVRR